MKQTTLIRGMARTSRLALATLFLSLAVIGCRSTSLPGISPEPSTLEKVVAAMSREEWDEADRLLTPILPPLSGLEEDGGERTVALRSQ